MNNVITFLNSAGKIFIDFSASMLIQSSVLIVVLFTIDRLLKKRVRAIFRYWIWMLVLVKLVLPVSLSSPVSLGQLFGDKLAVSNINTPVTAENRAIENRISQPEIPDQTLDEARGMMDEPRETIRPSSIIQHPSSPVVSVRSTLHAVPVVAFLGWLAVVAAMILLLIQRLFFVRGLLAQSKNADNSMNDLFEQCKKRLAVRSLVLLKLSPISASPSVCGLIRPTILIPQNLPGKLKDVDLQSILLHELSHIKRGDLWVSLIQTPLQIAYFYNPLLWVANAIIRTTREQAVDEMVLAAMGEQAERYPQTLLNVSKLTFSRPAFSLRLIGVVESKKALTERIKHIVGRPFPKTAKLGFLGLLIILAAAAILLPMAKNDNWFGKDVLIKFSSKDKPTGNYQHSSDIDTYSKNYTVRFKKGEKLAVVAELYQVGKPMRSLGCKIFSGSEQPQKLSVVLKKKYSNKEKTSMRHDLQVTLGDQSFNLNNIMANTTEVFSCTRWSFFDRAEIVKKSTTQPYIEFVNLLRLGVCQNGGKPRAPRIWMPTYNDVTWIDSDAYFISVNMLAFSQLDNLQVDVPHYVERMQLPDGTYISGDSTKEQRMAVADNYLLSIKQALMREQMPLPVLTAHKYYKIGEPIQITSEQRNSGKWKPTLGDIDRNGREEGICFYIIDGTEYDSTLGFGPFGGSGELKLHIPGDLRLRNFQLPVGRHTIAFGWRDIDVINPDEPEKAVHFDRLTTKAVEFEVVDNIPADYYSAVYEDGWEEILSKNVEVLFTDDSLKTGYADALLTLAVKPLPFDIAFEVYAQAEGSNEREYVSTLARQGNLTSGYRMACDTHIKSLNWDNVGQKRYRLILEPSEKDAIANPPIQHYYGRGYTTDWATFEKSALFDKHYQTFSKDIKIVERISIDTQETANNPTKNKFRATLPNGVTVELVGVCEHPSEGKQWWRPDGTELIRRPYDKLNYTEVTENVKHYEFVYRITGSEGVTSTIYSNANIEGISYRDFEKYAQNYIFSNPKDYRLAIINAKPETASVEFAIGVGVESAWKTICTQSSPVDNTGTVGPGVVFQPAIEKDGKTYLTIAYQIKEDEISVVAIDNAGLIHKPDSFDNVTASQLSSCQVSFNLPAAQIKEIRFQTQKYQRVIFKNVSLQPDVKTNLQIEIATENTEGTENNQNATTQIEAEKSVSRNAQTEPRLQIRMVVTNPVEISIADRLDYNSVSKPPESLYIQKRMLFDEADIVKAELQQSNDTSGTFTLQLTDMAAERMEVIKSANIGRRFAVVLDGKILSVSTISDNLASDKILLDVSSLDRTIVNSAVSRINEADKTALVQESLVDTTGWTQAEIALKNVMNRDPSFGESQKYAPQKLAIKAWENLLERKDLTDAMRIFATWRIASLCSYNMDGSLGEKPDSQRSEKLFKQVMNLVPGLFCCEIINSTTQYATHPGTDMERAKRLIESYRFIKSATPAMIAQSAARINKNGFVLNKKFFSNIMRLPDASIEEKTKLLNQLVDNGLKSLNNSISDILRYIRDETVGIYLLNSLNNIADQKAMQNWQSIKSQYLDSTWGDFQRKMQSDVQSEIVKPAEQVEQTNIINNNRIEWVFQNGQWVPATTGQAISQPKEQSQVQTQSQPQDRQTGSIEWVFRDGQWIPAQVEAEKPVVQAEQRTVPPIGNYALQFDGIDDIMNIHASKSLQLGRDFTIQMWLKPEFPDTNKPSTVRNLLSQGGIIYDNPDVRGIKRGNGYGFGFRLRPQGNFRVILDMVTGRGTNGGNYVASIGSPYESGWWPITISSGKSSGVYNGGIHISTSEYVYEPSATSPIIVGDGGDLLDSIGENFKGQIAGLRIWNRSLTPDEIERYDAMALTGNEPNLVGCWSFDQGQGLRVKDISPYKNDAILGSSNGTEDYRPVWVRITAEPQQESNAIPAAQIQAEKSALQEVTKQSEVTGIVNDPNGKPAAGAQVALSTSTISVTISNGKLQTSGQSRIVQADSQGRFNLGQRPAENFALIVANDNGFAMVEFKDSRVSYNIQLQPWGRIEGQLAPGRKAAENKIVMYSLPNSSWFIYRHDYRYEETYTNNDGIFAFEKVPAGWFEVGYLIAMSRGGSASFTCRTPVEVKAGETATMTLGGTGRPVIGRFVPPDGYNKPITFEGAWNIYTMPPEEPRPENFDKMTTQQQQEWYKLWRNTESYSQYVDSAYHNNNWRTYTFYINRDGSFQINDVISGKYRFYVTIQENTAEHLEIGGYSGDIEVPQMTEKYLDEPLDIGNLVLKMYSPLPNVGDDATLFDAKTLDGNDLKLTDYRGKYVLLSGWTTVHYPELQQVKEIYDTYRDGGQLVIIGLVGNDTLEEVRKYVSENKITWPVIFMDKNIDSQIVKDYSFYGWTWAFLIDPDGKIIARKTPGGSFESFKSAVEEKTK
jgi:beta-lactamase regulating signal transducer with metallopeptidase domain